MYLNEEMYQVHASKEKKSKLLTLLEKGKSEPKTLQHQCRSIIRRELSVHGQSILPLIEDLPISDIMKSFMKFEHIRTPLRETVSVDIFKGNYTKHVCLLHTYILYTHSYAYVFTCTF